MKTSKFIATVCVASLAFAAANQTYAQAREGGGTGHSHFIKVPATAEEIWKEIANQQTKLTSVVARKDLAEAHDHGYAIRDLVRALPGKVPAEHKAKAEAAAAEVSKIAAAIDKSSAAGAQKATEGNVRKLASAITGLRGELKATGS